MKDKKLIDALKRNDEAAFRKFVDTHRASVLRICTGFLHNSNDAQDVAQEVFIEVFRSAGRFRGDAKLSTWLYRIAINKSLNFIRSRKKHSILQRLESVTNNESTDIEDKTEDDSGYEEKVVMLQKALNELNRNQQIAFILHKYDNVSYKDISGIMGISLSSVESLIHRAKTNLQKKLLKKIKKDNKCASF